MIKTIFIILGLLVVVALSFLLGCILTMAKEGKKNTMSKREIANTLDSFRSSFTISPRKTYDVIVKYILSTRYKPVSIHWNYTKSGVEFVFSNKHHQTMRILIPEDNPWVTGCTISTPQNMFSITPDVIPDVMRRFMKKGM